MAIKNKNLTFKIEATNSWKELVMVLFQNDAMSPSSQEAFAEYKEKMIKKYGRMRFKFGWLNWDDKETIEALKELTNGH